MPATNTVPAIGRAIALGIVTCVAAATASADCINRGALETQVIAQLSAAARRPIVQVPEALRGFESATLSLKDADLVDRSGKLVNGGFRLINPDTGGTLEISDENRAYFADPLNKNTLVLPLDPARIQTSGGRQQTPWSQTPATKTFAWGGAGKLLAPYTLPFDSVTSKFNGDDDLAPINLATQPPPNTPSPPPTPKLDDHIVAILKVRLDGAVERCNGIQVLPGRIATALHCTDGASKIYVYFGDLREIKGADGKPVGGLFDFSGDYRCDATREFPAETDAQLSVGALDFAVLRVPGAEKLLPFNRAYTPFGSPSRFDGSVKAELPLAWITTEKKSKCDYLHKCSDASTACRIHNFPRTAPPNNVMGCGLREPYGKKHKPDKIYFVDGTTHTCDAHEAISGGALLSADRSRVLAIHMRGIGIDHEPDTANCAVPAEWLRTKLGNDFAARWKSD
jgi:hypothetical protein